MTKKIIFILLLSVLFSCGNNVDQPDPVEFYFDFEKGAEGWEGGYSGYKAGEEKFHEFLFEQDTLPGKNLKALKLSGNSRSEGIFMFIKRKITGLEPEKVYFLTFSIEFSAGISVQATENSENQKNVLFLKVGAKNIEPVRKKDEKSFYSMNISKGSNEKGGEDMMLIGGFSDEAGTGETLFHKISNESPFGAETDENGNLWIIIGTDSPFEGTTTIYYDSVKINCF